MRYLLITLVLLIPRGFILILWQFSGWFDGVFATKIWPVLGFLCVPYTLLAYSGVKNWFNGIWGFWAVILIIVAVIIDIVFEELVMWKLKKKKSHKWKELFKKYCEKCEKK